MTKFIIKILQEFQIVFKRKETYLWFVLIVFGIITRDNLRGISSIIAGLNLNPKCYESIVHFYYSKSYDIEKLRNTWIKVIFKSIEPIKIAERLLLLADHIKIAKEAKYMPGVKKHHQDSENSGKAEYIFGHIFGMIGIVTNNIVNYCIPVDIEIEEGTDEIKEFEKEKSSKETLGIEINCMTKILLMTHNMVMQTKENVLLTLDAYFSKASVFEALKKINTNIGRKAISIVTRARKNSVAFERVEKPDKPKVGRPKKYGNKIKLMKLFEDKAEVFEEAILMIYGKLEKVKYLQKKLLWKPIKSEMNFVLVQTGKKKMILMSEDLNLNAVDMITAYSYRFKIEVSFKMLKHTLGGFFYHFWTKAMPKISKYKTNTDYTEIKSKDDKVKLIETVRAIEIYTYINSIILGILMIVSLKYPKTIWNKYNGWIRTRVSSIPSPEIVKSVLCKEFLWNFCKISKHAIFEKIVLNQKPKNEKIFNKSA
jgi:hypothetical protein